MTTIEEIKARLAAATQGPWECDGVSDGDVSNLSIYGDKAANWVLAEGITNYGDANLFMHAAEDIAYLLSEVERLRCK